MQINGATVDPSNYTTEEGSTIVTFPIEYLQTLGVDRYEVAVVSDSKSVKGGFSVVAPEPNEHSFYYNQPYTGYVAYFDGDCTFFIREDGTIDASVGDSTDICTYSVDGDTLTVLSNSMGELHGVIANNGNTIDVLELGASFMLGDESVVADDEYIYRYDESLGGYSAYPIDKTKDYYKPIRTGINGEPTVKVGDYAFQDNGNIQTAPIIPDTVQVIGSHAFYNSTISSIDIPNNTTLISNGAFGQCGSLTSITLPNTGVTIAGSAFWDSGLTSIIIPGNANIIGTGVFCWSRLVSVIIEEGITEIVTSTFEKCYDLTTVEIPASVTKIGDYAFRDCSSLINIHFKGTVDEWKSISLGLNWNQDGEWHEHIPATHVQCTDGTVPLN